MNKSNIEIVNIYLDKYKQIFVENNLDASAYNWDISGKCNNITELREFYNNILMEALAERGDFENLDGEFEINGDKIIYTSVSDEDFIMAKQDLGNIKDVWFTII